VGGKQFFHPAQNVFQTLAQGLTYLIFQKNILSGKMSCKIQNSLIVIVFNNDRVTTKLMKSIMF